MNQRQSRQELLRLVATGQMVRVTRAIPCTPLHHGFILGIGHDLILLHQLCGFSLDGYAILRVNDITAVRSGDFERHWERMLAGEGTLKKLGIKSIPPLESTHRLLKALHARGENIIIECEDAKRDIEDFYIGQILSINAHTVEFANFDGMGRWDKNSHTISTKEITKVQIDTSYARTFSKYLEGHCPLKI